jgi:hypothetical protein
MMVLIFLIEFIDTFLVFSYTIDIVWMRQSICNASRVCRTYIVTQVSKRDVILKGILPMIQCFLYRYIGGVLILVKSLKTLTLNKQCESRLLICGKT